MSGVRSVLAFDFGASGGRAIRAVYAPDSEALTTEEIHRFENIPVEADGTLYWNFDELLTHIRTGLTKAGRVDSLSVDTWGVDFGLLDRDGKLIGSPVHYRDRRTEGVAAQVVETIGAEALYRRTGNQFLDLNTLFQLFAFRLIIVVVVDEIFNGVFREKTLKLTVELSGQRFVVAQYQSRFIDCLNHIGDGKSFARTGYPQQCLIGNPLTQPFHQSPNSFGLVARRLKLRCELKIHLVFKQI